MNALNKWAMASLVAGTVALSLPAAAQTGTTGSGQMGQPGTPAGAQVGSTSRQADPAEVDKFIQKAAVSNIAEIQLGQLAQQKAQDPEVKQFAQKMVDAHEKAQRQLEEVAGSAGVSLPSGLDEKHQRIQAKLDKLNGAEFDREYMKVIVDAHKDAEKLMRRRLEPPAPPPGDIGGAGSGTGAGTGAGTSGGGTAGTTGGTTTGGTTTGGSSGTTGATGTGGTGASGTSGRASPTARAVDDYAAMALPDVQQHLQEAKNLEKRIKDEGKNKDRDK